MENEISDYNLEIERRRYKITDWDQRICIYNDHKGTKQFEAHFLLNWFMFNEFHYISMQPGVCLGFLNTPKNNPIDSLHLSFWNQVLGVRKQTSTDGVSQELGLFPLPLQAMKMAMKNWERTHNQKADPIIIASHTDAIQCDLHWESSIRDTFMKNRMRLS